MKEMIMFVTEGTIEGRKEIAKINEYVNNFNFDCEFKRKIEQVPETWRELKELCNGLKEKRDKEIWEMEIKKDCICFKKKREEEIVFTCTGCMFSNSSGDLLMDKLTPARMWNIIKNLVG